MNSAKSFISDESDKSEEDEAASTTSIEKKAHPPYRRENSTKSNKHDHSIGSLQMIEEFSENQKGIGWRRGESIRNSVTGDQAMEGRKENKKEENNLERILMQKEIRGLPMIFGGLNTEKMALFSVYFPYNNCDAVVEYIQRKRNAQRKSTRNGTRDPKSFSTSGLIHFRNLQNFYNRNSNFKKKPILQRKISLSVFRRKSLNPAVK